MASLAAAARSWSRLTDSRPILLFLALSGGFWLGALASWELGRWDVAVILTGLGAAAPLLLMVAHVYRRPVLWVLRVPIDDGTMEAAVRQALERRGAAVGPGDSPSREGPFHACETVLRVASPQCLVGWRAMSKSPGTVESVQTTLYIMGGPDDALAMDALRGAISEELVRNSESAAS